MEKLPVKDTFKGPDAWFTGDVYGSPIYAGTEPSRVSATLVRFTPGARAHYDARCKAGHHHNAALRTLANKLLGKLWWCLRHHEPWDEPTAWQTGTPDVAVAA